MTRGRLNRGAGSKVVVLGEPPLIHVRLLCYFSVRLSIASGGPAWVGINVDRRRDRIVLEFANRAAASGWSDASLNEFCAELGISGNKRKARWPDGARSLGRELRIWQTLGCCNGSGALQSPRWQRFFCPASHRTQHSNPRWQAWRGQMSGTQSILWREPGERRTSCGAATDGRGGVRDWAEALMLGCLRSRTRCALWSGS